MFNIPRHKDKSAALSVSKSSCHKTLECVSIGAKYWHHLVPVPVLSGAKYWRHLVPVPVLSGPYDYVRPQINLIEYIRPTVCSNVQMEPALQTGI